MSAAAPRRSAVPWETIAAFTYAAWGIWHLPIVVRLWQAGGTTEPALLGVRLQQGAFHILFFALAAIVLGAWLIRRNSRFGFWIALVTIGWTEVGLAYLFMLPGLFPWWPQGWVGPALWLFAVAASTVAYALRPRTA